MLTGGTPKPTDVPLAFLPAKIDPGDMAGFDSIEFDLRAALTLLRNGRGS